MIQNFGHYIRLRNCRMQRIKLATSSLQREVKYHFHYCNRHTPTLPGILSYRRDPKQLYEEATLVLRTDTDCYSKLGVL
jgi:hypothetical protein